ncbi:hypothetical protein EV421DRAFT_1742681 [Armillaria borealis]|uniref:Uncharacterized protein n=1 Tax=Armillaria borealis TaxID=47425 RepID=A0AA39IY47_9AGAR|nr:hypothetical protein EV421DRAFT_1742681 [Armillaria borealis]
MSSSSPETRYGKDTLVLKHNKDIVESSHVPILQHSEPNLFISVVAADGVAPVPPYCLAEQEIRRRNHRTAACIIKKCCLVQYTSSYSQSIFVSVMQWKSFMQMVQITDSQIAVLIIEKCFGGRRLTSIPSSTMGKHLLKPRSKTLILIFSYLSPLLREDDKIPTLFREPQTLNLAAKGHPASVRSKVRICPWVPGTGMVSEVMSRAEINQSIILKRTCMIQISVPVSDLVGKGRSAWAYRLYLASATRRRFLRDRRVTQLDGIDLTDKSRADLAFSRFFWRMRMWDLVTGSGLYRGSKRATGSLGA